MLRLDTIIYTRGHEALIVDCCGGDGGGDTRRVGGGPGRDRGSIRVDGPHVEPLRVVGGAIEPQDVCGGGTGAWGGGDGVSSARPTKAVTTLPPLRAFPGGQGWNIGAFGSFGTRSPDPRPLGFPPSIEGVLRRWGGIWVWGGGGGPIRNRHSDLTGKGSDHGSLEGSLRAEAPADRGTPHEATGGGGRRSTGGNLTTLHQRGELVRKIRQLQPCKE